MVQNLTLETSHLIARFERAIKKFEIKKKIYRILFRGKGLEFEAYRNFGPDEDASAIDWKATLRAGGQLMARQYKEERELDIYYLFDCSNSMLFGSGKKLKAEYAGELVSVLAHMSNTSGDKPSLIMFSDSLKKFVPPSNSTNQFFLFKKFMSDPRLYGGIFEFRKAINEMIRFSKKSNAKVFVIISDFIRIKSDFESILKLLSTRGEVLAFMIRDEFDEDLPDTNIELVIQDPHSSKQLTVNPSVARAQFRANAISQKKAVLQMLKQSNVDYLELKTSEDLVSPLVSFLKSRVDRRKS